MNRLQRILTAIALVLTMVSAQAAPENVEKKNSKPNLFSKFITYFNSSLYEQEATQTRSKPRLPEVQNSSTPTRQKLSKEENPNKPSLFRKFVQYFNSPLYETPKYTHKSQSKSESPNDKVTPLSAAKTDDFISKTIILPESNKAAEEEDLLRLPTDLLVLPEKSLLESKPTSINEKPTSIIARPPSE